jgi:hypothetical protein
MDILMDAIKMLESHLLTLLLEYFGPSQSQDIVSIVFANPQSTEVFSLKHES